MTKSEQQLRYSAPAVWVGLKSHDVEERLPGFAINGSSYHAMLVGYANTIVAGNPLALASSNTEAIERLVEDTQTLIAKLLPEKNANKRSFESYGLGILFLDHILAETLDGIGKSGKSVANRIRKKSRKFWAEWVALGTANGVDRIFQSDAGSQWVAQIATEEAEELAKIFFDGFVGRKLTASFNETIFPGHPKGDSPTPEDPNINHVTVTQALAIILGKDSDAVGKQIFRLWDGQFAKIIMGALWNDKLRDQISDEQVRPAALTYAVHEPVADIFSRKTRLTEEANGQRTFDLRDGRAVLVVPETRPANYEQPVYDHEALQSCVWSGAEKFGTIQGHQLLRWQVFQGHRQWANEQSDPRALEINGGWKGLAEAAGMDPSNRNAVIVRDIIYAQAHLSISLPDGSVGNLLQYRYAPARGQRPSFLKIILGDPLMPGYVDSLKSVNTLRMREARRLVPMLPLPPLVGGNKTHGAQASLALAVASIMRVRANQLLNDGGVLISQSDWWDMSDRCGLNRKWLPAVLDRWTSDEPDALLQHISQERYILGPTHKNAHDFMVMGAKQAKQGRAAGRKSAATRKHRRAKSSAHTK